MKYAKEKKNSIFEGKSFYLIIALSLLAIGAASWMAYDRVQNEGMPSPNSSTTENISSEITVPPIIENDEIPTNPVDKEEDDVPYHNDGEETGFDSEVVPEIPVATNFILPLMGNISKEHSGDSLVFSKTYNDMRPHNGIDIIAEENAVVKACGSGVVTAIVEDIKLGKYIEIDHGNNLTAKYCGFDTVYVKEGETVDAVTKLGIVGTVPEECLDERHIHLEFYKDNLPTDPLSVIYPK